MKISSQIRWILIIAFTLLTSCGNETDSGLQDALNKGYITQDIKEADEYTDPKGSLIINSGAVATASTSATLTLTANDAVGVMAYYVSENSNTPALNSTEWSSISYTDSFSVNISFTLSNDEGSKTVYAWYKDNVGNLSGQVSDSIIYDITNPANPSVIINSGVGTATNRIVILTLSATDSVGVTGYYASESNSSPSSNSSGWIFVTSATSFSGNVSFTLSSGDASKTVYVWFKDAAGNVSPVANDSITTKIEAVTINGLEWQLATSEYNWYSAVSYCSNLDLSFSQDWRLPTIDELFALVDTSVSAPKIVSDLRDTTDTSKYSYYWSSTMYSQNTSYPMIVSYFDGRQYYYPYGKTNKHYVRCVR